MEGSIERRRPLPVKQAYKDIFKIALPCMLELMLIQLTGQIDLMMVGDLGTTAISAVGVAGQPIMILSMLFTALNVGTTAIVSRYRGADDYKNANNAMHHAVLLNLFAGTLMGVLGYFFAEPLVRLTGATDGEMLRLAVGYLRFRLIGLVPEGAKAAITASLRAMGNSRSALFYNTTANVINVLCNYLLIFGHWGFPEMGVNGAALATSVAQITADIIAVAILIKGKSSLKLSFKGFKLNKAIMSNIVKVGTPSMLEQLMFRAGILIYTRMAVSLGEIPYAGHQILLNIISVTTIIGQAVGMSTAPLTGQCLGKKAPEQAKQYNRCAFWMLFSIYVVCGLMYFFFGTTIMRLYVDDTRVIEAATMSMKLIGLYMPVFAVHQTFAGALQGAGDTKPIAIIMMCTVLFLRPVLAYIGKDVLLLELFGLHCATAIEQCTRSLLVFIRYRTGKWKTIKLK